MEKIYAWFYVFNKLKSSTVRLPSNPEEAVKKILQSAITKSQNEHIAQQTNKGRLSHEIAVV